MVAAFVEEDGKLRDKGWFATDEHVKNVQVFVGVWFGLAWMGYIIYRADYLITNPVLLLL